MAADSAPTRGHPSSPRPPRAARPPRTSPRPHPTSGLPHALRRLWTHSPCWVKTLKPVSAVRPAGSRLRPEGLAALLPRIPRGCGCWSPGASPTRPTCCPIPPLAYSRAPADPCSHSSSAPASELLAPLRPLRPKPRPRGPESPAAPHADSLTAAAALPPSDSQTRLLPPPPAAPRPSRRRHL